MELAKTAMVRFSNTSGENMTGQHTHFPRGSAQPQGPRTFSARKDIGNCVVLDSDTSPLAFRAALREVAVIPEKPPKNPVPRALRRKQAAQHVELPPYPWLLTVEGVIKLPVAPNVDLTSGLDGPLSSWGTARKAAGKKVFKLCVDRYSVLDEETGAVRFMVVGRSEFRKEVTREMLEDLGKSMKKDLAQLRVVVYFLGDVIQFPEAETAPPS